MPAEHVEMLALGIFFDHSARTGREAGTNLHVLQLVFARSERPVEDVGLAMGRAIVQPHARFDKAGGVFRRDRLSRHRAESLAALTESTTKSVGTVRRDRVPVGSCMCNSLQSCLGWGREAHLTNAPRHR